MAQITLHIESSDAEDLQDTLAQFLRGNAHYRLQARSDTAQTGLVPDNAAGNVVLHGTRVPSAEDASNDDRRAETVEQVQSAGDDDLKPVRGRNADDLAAKLIRECGAMGNTDWPAQFARLPKKHQEMVEAAVAEQVTGATPENGTGAREPQEPDTYKLVGAKGAVIDVFSEPDQFVSQLEDIAAKLTHRSDILALAAANADVVKTLPADDQKRLETAFGEVLKGAKDDAPAASTEDTTPENPERVAEAVAADAKGPTIDDVRTAVTEVANKLGMEAGRKVVVDDGKAAKISEIDPANYPAVIDACRKLLPAKGAA